MKGPWRETARAALEDAARVGQVAFDAEQPDAFRWIVPGEIEERRDQESARRR